MTFTELKRQIRQHPPRSRAEYAAYLEALKPIEAYMRSAGQWTNHRLEELVSAGLYNPDPEDTVMMAEKRSFDQRVLAALHASKSTATIVNHRTDEVKTVPYALVDDVAYVLVKSIYGGLPLGPVSRIEDGKVDPHYLRLGTKKHPEYLTLGPWSVESIQTEGQ